MPRPAAAPVGRPEPNSVSIQAFATVIGQLSTVQANTGTITDRLNNIIEAVESGGLNPDPEYIRTTVDQHNTFLHMQDQQVHQSMDDLQNTLTNLGGVGALEAYAHDLTVIGNNWEAISSELPNGLVAYLRTASLDGIRRILAAYQGLNQQIARFTIPKRIKALLDELHGVGASFDFHTRLKGEVPDDATRYVLLQELAPLDPIKVGGMVDVENGIIYRVKGGFHHFLSYLLIFGTAVVGGLFVDSLSVNGSAFLTQLSTSLALDGFVPVSEDPGSLQPYPRLDLFWGYVFLMVGVGVHIFKKAIEFSKARDKSITLSHVTLSRLGSWIHARHVWFVARVAIAVIGFIMLVDAGQLDWLKAALLGYTIDSLYDTIFVWFGTKVSPYAKQVQEALIRK